MKNLSFLALVFVSLSVAAQTNGSGTSVTRGNVCEQQKLLAYNPMTGTVPLAYGHMPATDLVCDSDDCGAGIQRGDVLTARQAHEYYKRRHAETRCQWTLADLEPVVDHESSHIWKGGPVSDHANVDLKDQDELEVYDLDSVEFASFASARLGNFRLTVNKPNFWGVPTQYSVYLSKNAHSFLLRKALLRKLGYDVPPVKRVARLKVQFPDKATVDKFLTEISIKNAGSNDRWVLSKDDKELVIQDVIVMEDQEFKHNLAKGYLSEDVFQGKRIYDSLIVPFALTDAPESLNLMDWTIGRRYSDNLVLKFPEARLYNCSRDDAVWMARRVLALTERDWQDIVDATELPPSPRLLLFEKLKSRRNHLAFLLNIDNVNLPVDAHISNHDDLVDGEITQEFYDGFARRFKIPDPESPLSQSEMTSFFWSKAVSEGLTMATGIMNNFLATDVSAEIVDFKEKLSENVAASMTEGSSNKLPIKAFAFPVFGGNLIFNRDIVTGSYLGTDNLIQLVDTVGASVNAGVFGGLTGIYSKTGPTVVTADGVARQFVPVDLNAGANLFLSRTYSHVKPITSVQKAQKYPWKNAMVPLLKRRYGKKFDSLMDEFYSNLTEDLKKERNESVYNSAIAMLDKVKFEHERAENAEFAQELADELQDLISAHADQKDAYLEASEQSEIGQIGGIFTATQRYYAEAKSLVKNKVLNDGICLVPVENGSDCAHGSDVPEITPELIAKHLPYMSSLLSSVDALNDLHNIHYHELMGNEEDEEIKSVMKSLNDNLEVGESIIVTDSFGGSVTVGGSANLYQVAQVRLNAKAQKVVLGRLHIFRASENEIHVYKDLGNVNSISVSASVEKYVPIMKFTFKGSKGNARTKFHKIPIGEKTEDGPNLQRGDWLRGLRNVLVSGSTKSLESIKAPYVIRHKFKEKSNKFGIFVWRWNWLKQSDEVSITTPEGDTKEMYRRNRGQTKGRDFENYTKDLVGILTPKILEKVFKKDFGGVNTVRSFNAGNPGYTFMGKAKNKIVTFEGIKDDNGEIPEPYVKVSRIHNGWKMSRDKAIKLLRQLKEDYSFRFVEEEVLAQTEELFLYNISVNFFVYEKGIKHMVEIPEDRAQDIFIYKRKYQRGVAMDREESLKASGYYTYSHHKRKYLQAKTDGDIEKQAKHAMRMVEAIEENLIMAGIGQMLGGGNNLFAIARIDGFRVGDPNGDKQVLSNSFGRIGTEDLEGPMARIKKLLGISTGEFTISWLLGRII